ncbi:MAG: uncharacterized protein QOJ16_3418 [Acidobacteriota bacterium]|nr:uncharacterized protein [Acidobacteriota bacterium]
MVDAISVLHFAGSAGYVEGRGGALIFETDDGGAASISGDDLAILLGNIPSLRLVFLNACDTAKTIGSGDFNPFRSVAATLVACGVPAVLGMQFPISDSAAFHFSEIFYQRLSTGVPIDVAITEGRLAVHIQYPVDMEWGTPVLYTRISDGAIFEIECSVSGDSPRLTIFLCHSSEDKEFIRDLYRRLTLEGYDPWLDEEKLLPGQLWEPEITRALRGSDIVIVCLSSNFIARAGFGQKEIGIALDQLQQQPEGSIYLIPAKIEDCKIPERLKHLHFVRIDEERGYRRLLDSLQRAKDSHSRRAGA